MSLKSRLFTLLTGTSVFANFGCSSALTMTVSSIPPTQGRLSPDASCRFTFEGQVRSSFELTATSHDCSTRPQTLEVRYEIVDARSGRSRTSDKRRLDQKLWKGQASKLLVPLSDEAQKLAIGEQIEGLVRADCDDSNDYAVGRFSCSVDARAKNIEPAPMAMRARASQEQRL
jgi:hypothetical protein